MEEHEPRRIEWKQLSEKMEDEVLDKCKVEEIKKGYIQRKKQPVGMADRPESEEVSMLEVG